MKRLARNRRTVHARQEHKAGRNLARLGGPTHWRGEALERFIGHGGWNQRGPNGAGCNSVDADAAADVLVRYVSVPAIGLKMTSVAWHRVKDGAKH